MPDGFTNFLLLGGDGDCKDALDIDVRRLVFGRWKNSSHVLATTSLLQDLKAVLESFWQRDTVVNTSELCAGILDGRNNVFDDRRAVVVDDSRGTQLGAVIVVVLGGSGDNLDATGYSELDGGRANTARTSPD